MEIHHSGLSDVQRYIERHSSIALEEKERKFEGILGYLRNFRTVDANCHMLEVGTGIGWFPILAKLKNLDCRGLEISPELIASGKEYGRRYGVDPDIELGNIEESDVGENVYDVVIASSVFEHVEHWQLGLKRVYRALKPGGLLFWESTNKFSITSGEYPLYCYGWMPDGMRYWFRKQVQGDDIMKHGIDFHQFRYPLLRRTFREVGFTKIHDRVALVRPETVASPLRRSLLRACQANPIIKETVLTFFEATTFVCVK